MLIRSICVYAYRRRTHVIGQHSAIDLTQWHSAHVCAWLVWAYWPPMGVVSHSVCFDHARILNTGTWETIVTDTDPLLCYGLCWLINLIWFDLIWYLFVKKCTIQNTDTDTDSSLRIRIGYGFKKMISAHLCSHCLAVGVGLSERPPDARCSVCFILSLTILLSLSHSRSFEFTFVQCAISC